MTPSLLCAEESHKPLFEFGFLTGAANVFEYPGSDQSRLRYIVFPNFRYRGKTFRSDEEEGTIARVLRDRVVNLDMSFGFSFPANSDDDSPRVGMPDLDYTGEIGPRVNIRLYRNSNGDMLRILLPIRFTFVSDFTFLRDQGALFAPAIQLILRDFFYENFDFIGRIGFEVGNERFNDYFYDVSPRYQTPNRPAYDARAGYNGAGIFTGFLYNTGTFQAFLGIRHANFSGSANDQSPLFKTENATTFILGLGWLFYKSDRKGYK